MFVLGGEWADIVAGRKPTYSPTSMTPQFNFQHSQTSGSTGGTPSPQTYDNNGDYNQSIGATSQHPGLHHSVSQPVLRQCSSPGFRTTQKELSYAELAKGARPRNESPGFHWTIPEEDRAYRIRSSSEASGSSVGVTFDADNVNGLGNDQDQGAKNSTVRFRRTSPDTQLFSPSEEGGLYYNVPQKHLLHVSPVNDSQKQETSQRHRRKSAPDRHDRGRDQQGYDRSGTHHRGGHGERGRGERGYHRGRGGSRGRRGTYHDETKVGRGRYHDDYRRSWSDNKQKSPSASVETARFNRSQSDGDPLRPNRPYQPLDSRQADPAAGQPLPQRQGGRPRRGQRENYYHKDKDRLN